jgi:GcrA cell cycle regulator
VPKLADMVPVQGGPLPEKKTKAKAPVSAPASMIVETPGAPVSRITARRVNTCCWPIGHPGTPSFCFCEKEAPLGKPYCAEHAGVAYISRGGPEAAAGAQAD